MNKDRVIFLVRGLPGSGRTTAIERVRENFPRMIFVDADPLGIGEEFSSARAHHDSLQRAAEDIRGLVQHGVEAIAIETCAPRAIDVNLLLDDAREAGYSIEALDPTGHDPKDVISCFEKSSHQPSPEFLQELVIQWEEVDLNPGPKFDVAAQDRATAFKLFLKAMGAPTYEAAQAGMVEVFERFPREAANLQLDVGPSWGRFRNEQEPSFPLAGISIYWAEMKNSAELDSPAYRSARRLMTPEVATPGFSIG